MSFSPPRLRLAFQRGELQRDRERRDAGRPPLQSLRGVSSPSCRWHSMASVAVVETHSSSGGTVGTREQVPSPKLD